MIVALDGVDLSCYGSADGVITSEVSGGTPDYTYRWDDPLESTTENLTDVDAGTYTLTVTDSLGATGTESITITQPSPITLIPSFTNATTEGGSDGTASVVASGGTGDYTYLWSPGNQTTSSITGLTAGNYSVVVTDENGCTAGYSFTIGEDVGPGVESALNVVTSNIDLNYLLNTVHDEEIDCSVKNVPRDRFASPMGENLYAMLAGGRLPIGLSDSHEVRYQVPTGQQINGTRFDYGIDCADLQGPVQYDPDAILNSMCCGIGHYDFYERTLQMAQIEGSRVLMVHNARINSSAEILIALAKYTAMIPDAAPIVVFGFEFSNVGYDNAETFPNGVSDYVAAMEPTAQAIWAVYPNAQIIVHTPEVHRNANHIPIWIDGIQLFNWDGHAPAAMMYDAAEDLKTNLDDEDSYKPVPISQFDADQWMSSMLDGVLNTFPSHIALYKERLPGYKLLLARLGLSGTGDNAPADYLTTNSMLFYAMMNRQVMIEHMADPTLIVAGCWYKPNKVEKVIPRNDWWAHCIWGEQFRNPGAKMCTVTTNIPGVYADGVKVGNEYVLHVINTSEFDVGIPDINFDGTVATGFTGKGVYGTAQNSTTVLFEDFSGTIRKFGIYWLKKTLT